LLQTLAKTTSDSSRDGIKMPSLSKIVGGYMKMSFCRIPIILKTLLHLNLRRIYGVIKMDNPNLEDQKHLLVLNSAKKKINIVKIRTNSHELHSETGCWTIPKTPWDERICHLCDTKRVEDENHFLLECPMYTQIRSQFQNIYHNTDLPNLLSHQNYGDLGTLLLKLFEHRNKILKKSK
jgi:hypothetical protein